MKIREEKRMGIARQLLAACLCLGLLPSPGLSEPNDERAREEEAFARGREAYIYGFPLVMMGLTKEVATAVPAPTAGMSAPVNQFSHMRAFPSPEDRSLVSPNADTLYSTAFLDLSQEPILLQVPDTKERYHVMQMMDAWTNVFAAPGRRTTGTKEGNFAIAGPGWKGTLPQGVTEIRSPTNLVWIIGRTQTNGPADFPVVHGIQNGYTLTPLSAFGKPYTPPAKFPVVAQVDRKTPPVTQVVRMDADAFFTKFASLMKHNPPAPADAPSIKSFETIGIVPGKDFEWTKLDPAAQRGLRHAVQTTPPRMETALGIRTGIVRFQGT